MQHHTKNKVSMLTPSKFIARTDGHTHTDTQTNRHDKNITSTAYAGGKVVFAVFKVFTLNRGDSLNTPSHNEERCSIR